MKVSQEELLRMWARHTAEWRDTAQICSQWRDAGVVDPALLETRADRGWWNTLAELGITLLVSREYEHLLMAASAPEGRPHFSFLSLPHPSGVAVDRKRNHVYVASTRNPNQVHTFAPASSALEREDIRVKPPGGAPLAPVISGFYPGCMYLHDLAMVGGELHGNAVGHNAVVRLLPDGSFKRVWWPKCIEMDGRPVFSRNHIQLNSIAAGKTLRSSFFSASSAAMGRLRPGHLNYPVNGRGVIFSGETREVVCTGLTRPHSARLHKGTVWVANSGYGELGFVSAGKLEVAARLPGWTRGLCLVGNVAFVGTSRVIPRFYRYAPGLDPARSRCAVHAVARNTGTILGTMEWPAGNQIFAIDWISSRATLGFPFEVRTRRKTSETAFFYSYLTR